MSIYVMVGLNIRDADRYAEYAAPALASLQKYNVEILAVSDTAVTIEGVNPYGRFVLLRFPDAASFDAWYQSPEYSAARPIRYESSDTGFFVTVEGLG